MALKEATDVRAECGTILHQGDRAYSHYTMSPGVIENVDTSPSSFGGWFTFRHDDGTTTLLNGGRICSLAYAKSRGWPDAE